MSNQTSNQWQHLTYTQKLSLMASSVATLYLLPTEAQAAIIYNGNPLPPVSITDSGNPITIVPWDVDGDGNADFNLKVSSFSTAFGSRYKYFDLTSAGLDGRGFIRGTLDSSVDIRQVPDDGRLINSLGAGLGLVWGSAGANYRIIASFYDGPPWIKKGNFNLRGFDFNTTTVGDVQTQTGANKIGFRIAAPGGGPNDFLYGWATLAVNNITDLNTGEVLNSGFTITEWAYNNTRNAGINVGDTGGNEPNPIPESSSPLALLGLGAAGIYCWRKQKQN